MHLCYLQAIYLDDRMLHWWCHLSKEHRSSISSYDSSNVMRIEVRGRPSTTQTRPATHLPYGYSFMVRFMYGQWICCVKPSQIIYNLRINRFHHPNCDTESEKYRRHFSVSRMRDVLRYHDTYDFIVVISLG